MGGAGDDAPALRSVQLAFSSQLAEVCRWRTESLRGLIDHSDVAGIDRYSGKDAAGEVRC